MKPSVSRALQVVALREPQIQELHAIEQKRFHLLANWNIQEIFHLGSIRERFRIPEEAEKQALYAAWLDQELLKNRFVRKQDPTLDLGIDSWHSYDWLVFKNQEKIVWESSGYSTGKRGLADRIKSFAALG